MSEVPFNDNKKLLSEFNEAGFQIMRLHNLWLDCHRFSRGGEYDKWNWTLDRIWNELYPDVMGHRNKDVYLERSKVYNTLIKKAITKDQKYFCLNNKEGFLKCLQDDVGKGSKRSQHYEEIM